MKLAIKEYWENLKVEYEATYNASIFSDYNVLMQYAERFESYLRGLFITFKIFLFRCNRSKKDFCI